MIPSDECPFGSSKLLHTCGSVTAQQMYLGSSKSSLKCAVSSEGFQVLFLDLPDLSSTKNPLLEVSSAAPHEIPERRWLVAFTTRQSCCSFKNTNFSFKDNNFTLTEYQKNIYDFP